MTDKLLKLVYKLHPTRLSELAAYLLKDEAISGKLIIGAATLALIIANSPFNHAFESFWHTGLSIGLGQWSMSLDLRHWLGEGLMTFFFLVVGLELKRELTQGELKNKQAALLPIVAAVGGMVVPALLYLAINAGNGTQSGWAIPTATDIALAIGVLALLGKRIPASIRIFLLALAIVDDILAVLVIAIFYNSSVNYSALLIGLLIAAFAWGVQRTKYISLPLFTLIGVCLWVAFYNAGIHPSISGALVGLLAPLTSRRNKHTTIAEQAERAVIPISTLVVVPLFALANTGITFHSDIFSNNSIAPVALGIVVGLVCGKVIGIVGASWLMVRAGLVRLPSEARWGHIIGVGLLAGIGFTVSIFVTELAFTDPTLLAATKLSIFIGSALSAVLGMSVLYSLRPTDN